MEIRKEGGLRGAGAPDEARLAKINAYARTPLTAEAVYCFRVRLRYEHLPRDRPGGHQPYLLQLDFRLRREGQNQRT